MKLHTENIGGNIHQAAEVVNKLGWAEYVIQMTVVGLYTIVVFRVPDDFDPAEAKKL